MFVQDSGKTIAWDVDDVLNDSMRAWLEHCWMWVHRANAEDQTGGGMSRSTGVRVYGCVGVRRQLFTPIRPYAHTSTSDIKNN